MDIIIPHSNTNEYRARNLKFTVDYYKKHLSEDDNIIVCEQIKPHESPILQSYENVKYMSFKTDDEYFCKSILINGGVNYGKSEVIMLVDNDCILDENILRTIEYEMRSNEIQLLYPYTDINFLNEGHTRQYIRSGTFIQSKKPSTMHMNRYTGGVVMFSRALFNKVNGFDDEIKGWGKEDDAFLAKCKRLKNMKIERNKVENTLLHLFHPPISKTDYMKSDRYRLNSEMLAVIKRMNEKDFYKFLMDKHNGDKYVLTKYVSKYKEMGKLELEVSIQCGGRTFTIDTSAYGLTPGIDGNVGLEELLNSVYEEDGIETVQLIIGMIDRGGDLTSDERNILNKFILNNKE